MLKDPGPEKREGHLRQKGTHKQGPEMGETFGTLRSPVGIRDSAGEWKMMYGGVRRNQRLRAKWTCESCTAQRGGLSSGWQS